MSVRHCKFCDNPATYAPLEVMEQHGIKVYFCHPCQAEYLYFGEPWTFEPAKQPSSTSLYTVINGRTYRWTVGAGGYGALWLIGKRGIPGQVANEELEFVLRIEKMEGVHITPQNVESKIKSWLAFL